MNKPDIIAALEKNHNDFLKTIAGLEANAFLWSAQGKWHAGQQLDHICRSVAPVALAFALPKCVPPLLFGKANRPSKSYEDLVAKYKIKLDAGGRATGRFVPKPVVIGDRSGLSEKLSSTIQKLVKRIDRFSESELDQYILPHPLLGKLTLREMLYFTMYHVQHHEKQVVENLGEAF